MPRPHRTLPAIERATLILGTALVAALTLLPWHGGGPPPTPGGADGRTAVQAPLAPAGVASALAAAGVVVWLGLAVVPERPRVAVPGRTARLALAGAALAAVVVKLLADLDDLRVGAFVSVALAAALVVAISRGR